MVKRINDFRLIELISKYFRVWQYTSVLLVSWGVGIILTSVIEPLRQAYYGLLYIVDEGLFLRVILIAVSMIFSGFAVIIDKERIVLDKWGRLIVLSIGVPVVITAGMILPFIAIIILQIAFSTFIGTETIWLLLVFIGLIAIASFLGFYSKRWSYSVRMAIGISLLVIWVASNLATFSYLNTEYPYSHIELRDNLGLDTLFE